MNNSGIDYGLLIAASRQAKEFLDNYGVPPSDEDLQKLQKLEEDYVLEHNLQDDLVYRIYSDILAGKEPPSSDSLNSLVPTASDNSKTTSAPSMELAN